MGLNINMLIDADDGDLMLHFHQVGGIENRKKTEAPEAF